ncbi:DHH family phosphoesterase [Candidatus Micrarchaeota archaeon]|nr:DHH family phosphoesterase [Candidatus Micrarchaeota archaeon]
MEDFFKHAKEIGDACLSLKNPVIVHHLDCDGLASAAIVKQAFLNEGKEAETLMLKKMDASAKIPEDKDLVFTDLGSGQLELVEKLPNKNKIIIDHHPPSKETEIFQANCHLHGLDGTTDACAASTAYFCFAHKNINTVLGIVGMVGDMQERDGIKGLNVEMVKRGIENGEVLKTRDLRVFGKVTRPLVSFLSYCTEPYLPGLTGNDKACAVFLKNNCIETHKDGKQRAYYDLSVFERKTLVSALVEYAHQKDVESEAIGEMIGDVYLFVKEQERSERREAYEFSTLLNACGRNNAPKTGIDACLGKKEAAEQALSLLLEHRRNLRAGIGYARRHTMDAGPFYLLDGREKISDTIIGVVCGAYFTSGLVERSKPVIGLSVDNENALKASGRGTKELVENGLDLGEAMKKAAEPLGGYGGGHTIAAGASFPNTPENLKAFLLKVKEVVEVQLQLR